MAIWAADVCSRAARQLICIEPTGLRLRCIGKTDPQCGTVQFCFHSGRLTCTARTGFRAVTTPLKHLISILPVRVSPEIWLSPRGHVDLNSLGNDPSVCNFCNFSSKLTTTALALSNKEKEVQRTKT